MNATLSKPAPVLSPQARGPNSTPRHASSQGISDLAIGLAGLLYLGIVLFADWTSPLFGMTVIALAGYKLFAHHCGKGQE